MPWDRSRREILVERSWGRYAGSWGPAAWCTPSAMCQGAAVGRIVGDAKAKAPVETSLKKTTKVGLPLKDPCGKLGVCSGRTSSCLWPSHVPMGHCHFPMTTNRAAVLASSPRSEPVCAA